MKIGRGSASAFAAAIPPTLALVILAGLGLVLAQSPAPKQDLSDFEKRLAKINGQISELRGKIEAEALKETSILSNLARINLNKDLVEREVAAQNLQM